jgi:hypothetical protein
MGLHPPALKIAAKLWEPLQMMAELEMEIAMAAPAGLRLACFAASATLEQQAAEQPII